MGMDERKLFADEPVRLALAALEIELSPHWRAVQRRLLGLPRVGKPARV